MLFETCIELGNWLYLKEVKGKVVLFCIQVLTKAIWISSVSQKSPAWRPLAFPLWTDSRADRGPACQWSESPTSLKQWLLHETREPIRWLSGRWHLLWGLTELTWRTHVSKQKEITHSVKPSPDLCIIHALACVCPMHVCTHTESH